jgi:hypothetical protein
LPHSRGPLIGEADRQVIVDDGFGAQGVGKVPDAAQDATHARHHLRRIERLGDVILGELSMDWMIVSSSSTAVSMMIGKSEKVKHRFTKFQAVHAVRHMDVDQGQVGQAEALNVFQPLLRPRIPLKRGNRPSATRLRPSVASNSYHPGQGSDAYFLLSWKSYQ